MAILIDLRHTLRTRVTHGTCGAVVLALCMMTTGCSEEAKVVHPPGSDAVDDTTGDTFDDPGADIAPDPLDDVQEVDDSDSAPLPTRTWSSPIEEWPGALLSVHGRADDDVWIAGAAVEGEATLLHWDGITWTRVPTGFDGDLWWVQVLDDGTVLAAGERSTVLRGNRDGMERVPTPGLARQTLFGLYAHGPDDFWVMGGIGSRGGFAWHYQTGTWSTFTPAASAPTLDHGDTAALFKAWPSRDGMLFVGGLGGLWKDMPNGELAAVARAGDTAFFTIAGNEDEWLAVGGGQSATVLSWKGGEATIRTFDDLLLLQGVAFSNDGTPWVSGLHGALFWRDARGMWHRADTGLAEDYESLHAVWVSPGGAVWSVGGDVLGASLDRGILVHGAPAGLAAPANLPAPEVQEENWRCSNDVVHAGEGGSIARRWNEQNLAAIRLALPEPTVHARNLFHLSVAMHDAWAAYTADYTSLIDNEDLRAGDGDDRDTTISYAAYTLLQHRYAHRTGGATTADCLTRVMEALGLDPDADERSEDTPAGRGQRIADAVIAYFREDGAREAADYTDPTYQFSNPPHYVDDPGIAVVDPSTWQPLDISRAVTQNGIPEPAGPQQYIGPHWGGVSPFAVRRPAFDVPYYSLRDRPDLQSPEIAEWVADVLRRTAWLDIDDGVEIDISPGGLGNHPLGTDDGAGHPVNPRTGEPYAPQWVPRGDFGRVLAEYWADGPNSETPPGHWNRLANDAFDHPTFRRYLFGEGPEVDRLTWDIWAYLILNGALHDAAIVAWDAKRRMETARPSTLIRYMAARGQRTSHALPSWHPDGLPLEDGLIELITEESSAPGERHAHLRRHIGEIAVWSWPGEPSDAENQRSPMRWIRGVEWMPYQPRTFVNPAFPGYVSGHSTFSRAAAVVLHRLTDSAYFPGGMAEFVAPENAWLEFERGPSREVRLQWATYYDAADQAGQSRIWGGIHIVPDDYDGRRMGQAAGEAAATWGMQRLSRLLPFPELGDPTNPLHGGLPNELPDDIGGPPTGSDDLTLGTGRRQWEPLRQGDTLLWERGTQGGHHLWLTGRASLALLDALTPAERNRVETAYEVLDGEGLLVARTRRFGGYTRTDEGWDLFGTFVPNFGATHPNDLAGRPLTIRATLTLPDESTHTSEVRAFTLCCQ